MKPQIGSLVEKCLSIRKCTVFAHNIGRESVREGEKVCRTPIDSILSALRRTFGDDALTKTPVRRISQILLSNTSFSIEPETLDISLLDVILARLAPDVYDGEHLQNKDQEYLRRKYDAEAENVNSRKLNCRHYVQGFQHTSWSSGF